MLAAAVLSITAASRTLPYAGEAAYAAGLTNGLRATQGPSCPCTARSFDSRLSRSTGAAAGFLRSLRGVPPSLLRCASEQVATGLRAAVTSRTRVLRVLDAVARMRVVAVFAVGATPDSVGSA